MLRTLLLGLLAVTAATACDRGGAAPAARPGAIAGEVVEVTGEVTAIREAARRTLRAGAKVSSDDLVETGAGGHVVIVLAHNNARWELGENQQQQVASSLAWGLPRKEGPAAAGTEHTAAAGRHGERSAASAATTASSDEEVAQEKLSADRGGAPEPKSRSTGVISRPLRKQGGGGDDGMSSGGVGVGGVGARASDGFRGDRAKEEGVTRSRTGEGQRRDALRLEEAGDATEKVAKDTGPAVPTSAPPDPAVEVRQALSREKAAMKACLHAGPPSIEVELVVEDGVATFAIPDASAQVRACFAKIAARIELTSTATLRFKSTVTK